MKVVEYHRVSTARQGASGVELEAQTRAITDYTMSKQATVIASFREIESGKSERRPELQKALHLCKVTGDVPRSQ